MSLVYHRPGPSETRALSTIILLMIGTIINHFDWPLSIIVRYYEPLLTIINAIMSLLHTLIDHYYLLLATISHYKHHSKHHYVPYTHLNFPMFLHHPMVGFSAAFHRTAIRWVSISERAGRPALRKTTAESGPFSWSERLAMAEVGGPNITWHHLNGWWWLIMMLNNG